MINSAEFLIIKRYLKPKTKDSFLKIISTFSFLGIALGVATLIVVMSVMNGFRVDLMDKLLSYQPHISIEASDKENKDKEEIYKIAKSLEIEIENFSLVNNSEALIVTKNDNFGVSLKGVKNENNFFIKNSIIRGVFDKEKIGIGIELASKLSINVGDKVSMLSNNSETTPFGIFPRQFVYEIGFIFNTGIYDFDNNVLILDIVKSIEMSKNLSEYEIKIDKPDLALKFTKKLKQKYEDRLIYSWIDNNKTFYDALKVERNVMFIILTLIIIVAAFNIISGLTILIKNKSKEISIMRSMGFKKKSILKIFLIIGSWIGVLGTLVGSLLGIVISIYLEDVRLFLNYNFGIEIFPSEIYFLNQLPSYIDYHSIALIFLCSTIIVFLSSLFPAINASKLDPIRNLKNE